MAYTSGDLILDTHHNGFVSDVNTVWGQGTGDSGYGQSSTLSTVADGQTITATQWANLISKISTIASHQGSSITSITQPNVGDTIAVFNALTSNISTIETNRLDVAGYGTVISTTGQNTTNWTNTLTITNTFTFAGGDEARYFFNAGGELRISSTHGSGSTTKDSEWGDTLTKSGTYVLAAQDGGKSGGSGSPTINLTTTGYYDLPDTAGTVMFRQFADSSPYTANYYQIRMWTNTDHSDGRGNNGTQITVEVTLQDDAADDFDDTITGTTTTTFEAYPPATTFISNTWGSPTWGTASVSVS